MTPCPCGSGLPAEGCCGRFLDEIQSPPTAEALMRSRYVAYVRRDAPYLLATWHASTRPAALDVDTPPRPTWIGLSVLRHERLDESRAEVEFVARYKLNGRAHKLHETSRFVLEDGRWYYVDGDIVPQA